MSNGLSQKYIWIKSALFSTQYDRGSILLRFFFREKSYDFIPVKWCFSYQTYDDILLMPTQKKKKNEKSNFI